MKQLKFMLAAATAVGFAAAAQADDTWKDTFEDGVIPAGWSFTPASESDSNDSEVRDVEANTVNTSAKALKVNTGTTPYLRALEYDGLVNEVNLTGVQSVYVDTMVKFTVTPAGDDVTVTSDDKLMIYLKERKDDDGAITGTNLVVRAAGLVYDQESDAFTEEIKENGVEYIIEGYEIDLNSWYRLKVVAKAVAVGEGYWPVFNVYLNDEQLSATNSSGFDVDDFAVEFGDDYEFDGTADFVSLQLSDLYNPFANNADEMSLLHVGFAGEGWVDDLAFGSIAAATSVDFTLALDESVSSVKFTVGGNTYTLDADTLEMTIEDLDLNSEAEIIEVKYAEYCVPATGDLIAGSKIALNAATVSKVVKASTKLAEVKGEVTPEMAKTEYKVAENAQIFTSTSDNATEAGAEITSAQIAKILDWNNRVNGGKIADVNSMKFVAGEPDGNSAEAYLLNCSTAELAKEKEEFKFSPEDLASLMTSGLSATGLDADKQKYIGEFVLEGASALNGEATDWKDSAKWTGEEKPAFYRARLIFK